MLFFINTCGKSDVKNLFNAEAKGREKRTSRQADFSVREWRPPNSRSWQLSFQNGVPCVAHDLSKCPLPTKKEQNPDGSRMSTDDTTETKAQK